MISIFDYLSPRNWHPSAKPYKAFVDKDFDDEALDKAFDEAFIIDHHVSFIIDHLPFS